MTGAELAAEIAEAIAQDSRLDAIREKIEAGTADLKDSEQYTAICAEITGRMMRGAVAGLDDREESFTEIARERYRETFDIYSAVQAIIDRALGIRIAAKEPGFQEDRARKIGHALEDRTVPESTILRRAESASENFVMSQHDRCVEENAKFRDRAGLQSYAVRTGGAKCCQWCADVSGKYPANETPDGFWGRHDNCKCSILYESRRGTQLLGGTSKKWEVAAEGAGAGELHRLSGDEAATAGAPEPVVFTKEQAEALQAEKGLTILSENGTMKAEGMLRKASSSRGIEPMPKKQFRRIARAFKAHGGVIQQSPETDEYLRNVAHAEGTTYNATTILLMQKPSRASVFEELIHSEQYRNGRNDGSPKSRIMNEIEAQEKLLRNAKYYKLTEPEIIQTQEALAYYRKELEKYYRNGGE